MKLCVFSSQGSSDNLWKLKQESSGLWWSLVSNLVSSGALWNDFLMDNKRLLQFGVSVGLASTKSRRRKLVNVGELSGGGISGSPTQIKW